MAESYKPERKKGKLRPHKKVPEKIKNRPSLDQALIFVWDSFNKLNTERLKDHGLIPYSKVIWFCDRHKIEDVEEFEYLIRRLDGKFLELNRPK